MPHVTHVCLVCSTTFTGDPRRRYCSSDCAAEAARRRANAWYYENRDDPGYQRRAKELTRKHYEKVIADPKLKAKRLAATAKWRAENREHLRESERAYREANPDYKRTKDHRSRARRLGVFVEDVKLSVLFARDAGRCGICGEQADMATRWPDPLTATIDHVIPMSRGGLHEYANVQLAHAVCNSRKNDRVA